MPPKATIRRRPGVASREADSAPVPRGAASALLKPNLPPLQGTPSSRRQYSYGAAAEPPPWRPGRGVQRGQVLDLSSAVRSALIRQHEEELEDEDESPRSQMQLRARSHDPEEDELAADTEVGPPFHNPQAPGPLQAVRNALFGSRAEEQIRGDDSRTFSIESDYFGDATIASTPGSMPPPPALRPSHVAGNSPADLQTQGTRRRQSRRLRGLSEDNSSGSQYEPDAASHETETTTHRARRGRGARQDSGSEEGDAVKPILLRRGAERVNMFAPKRAQGLASQGGAAQEGAAATARGLTSARVRRADTGASGQGPEAGRSGDDGGSERPSSEPSTPTDSSGRQSGADNRGIEDEEPAINWWQLLNPWTYVKTVAWVVGFVWQWAADLISLVLSAPIWNQLLSLPRVLPYLPAALAALALGLAVSNGAVSFKLDASSLWYPAGSDTVWRSLDGVTSRIGGFLPTVTWPGSGHDDLADLWEVHKNTKVDDLLKKLEKAFQSLQKASKLHADSLKKLETVVPKMVHMELQNGKPVVVQDFWHALRDLIQRDGTFLTFDTKGREYEVGSERQWKAIAARLMGDPAFASKLNSTVGEAESRLHRRISGFWDAWVRDNEAKTKQALGAAVDQVKSAVSERELGERLGSIVREQLQGPELKGVVVGRDEFLRHVEGEFAKHRAEIRAELGELQPQVAKLVRESLQLASGDAPPGMSRAEATALVSGLVRKTVADMNLEAMARGKIRAHWDAELKNQVNYLSAGAGAIIDAKHTSPTYDLGSEGAGPGVRKAFGPSEAQAPWLDEGDCWCAANTTNRHGKPHGAALGVVLARFVVPQHVVVEHMLPGATTDPGARPRHIEVYAAVEDAVLRERVRDFAAAHFPDDDAWDFAPPDYPGKFVKISRFEYHGAEAHDGVYVHRLSAELLPLRAATEHLIVRAVSNYGANHTCFYRVRMYGVSLEDA